MTALAAVDRILAVVMWLAAAVVVVALFAGPALVGAKKEGAAPAAPAPASPAAAEGKQVFADAGCGSCHTLAAAGSSGAVGPNLDELKPAAAAVAAIVRSGGSGMPAFGDLSPEEVAAVAQFVARSAR
jgi:mono/diheme cytochrome c family protein